MKTIKCKKSEMVQTLLRLRDKQYSLEGRPFMNTLYDIQEKKMVLMMGRQLGKSTFIASDSLMDVGLRPFFNILYVAPRKDQAEEFSSQKLGPFIEYSPRYKELFCSSKLTQKVSNKVFKNGSSMKLKYAFLTADAIRGVSADKVTLDEVQDIMSDNIPVIEECLSGSDYKWKTYAGTPKTLNNTLTQIWEMSTQNEWALKCPHCNTWNILGMENLGLNGIICKKCGGDLPRDSEGHWVSKKTIDNRNIFMPGFRLPQIMSPKAEWSDIMEKRKKYSHTKFMNEVMALPYENAANPITEQELRAACDPYRKCVMGRSPSTNDMRLFAGVDWGHGDLSIKSVRGERPTGFTVVTVGGFDAYGNFKVLGMKRFDGKESDPVFQVKYVTDLIKKEGVLACGCDYGEGFLHNKMLQDNTNPERIIQWQASAGLKSVYKWNEEARRMIFNRTECMTARFLDIKKGRIQFYNWEEFKDIAPDFLTINIQFRSGSEEMYYDHTLPDDAFHSMMLCYMTAAHLLGVR